MNIQQPEASLSKLSVGSDVLLNPFPSPSPSLEPLGDAVPNYPPPTRTPSPTPSEASILNKKGLGYLLDLKNWRKYLNKKYIGQYFPLLLTMVY